MGVGWREGGWKGGGNEMNSKDIGQNGHKWVILGQKLHGLYDTCMAYISQKGQSVLQCIKIHCLKGVH